MTGLLCAEQRLTDCIGVSFCDTGSLGSPPADIALHPLLGGQYRATAFWDVTQDPSTVRQITAQGALDNISPALLTAPATEPRAHFMKIVCDDFPWDVTIKVPRDEDVTVELVFTCIFGALQEPLLREEWDEETKNCRRRMHKARCMRLARTSASFKLDGPVRRVDFLTEKTIFMGLKPVGPPDAPDEWLLKLGLPPRERRRSH
jgi:hypothetical protein